MPWPASTVLWNGCKIRMWSPKALGTWLPLHRYFLAGIIGCTGSQILMPMLAHVVLGSLLVVPVYAMTKRAFPDKPTWLVALFIGCVPVLFQNSAHTLTGVPTALLAITPPVAVFILAQAVRGIWKKSWAKDMALWSLPLLVFACVFGYKALNGTLYQQHRFTGLLVVLSWPLVAWAVAQVHWTRATKVVGGLLVVAAIPLVGWGCGAHGDDFPPRSRPGWLGQGACGDPARGRRRSPVVRPGLCQFCAGHPQIIGGWGRVDPGLCPMGEHVQRYVAVQCGRRPSFCGQWCSPRSAAPFAYV